MLASIDEVALVTLLPGFATVGADYDTSFDNIRLIARPEPSAMSIAGAAAAALLARRRFARRSGIA